MGGRALGCRFGRSDSNDYVEFGYSCSVVHAIQWMDVLYLFC